MKKIFIAQADDKWMVQSVCYEGALSLYSAMRERYPLLYRDDAPEHTELWSIEYQQKPSKLWGIPISLHLEAKDELDAYMRGQEWLNQHRAKPLD